MALSLSLLEAASRGHAAQLARLLRTPSIDVNVVDENGCSALQRAAADGHVEAVELLLKHGADPNKQDIVHGNTATHEAAWKGYSRCAALLAAGRADLHLRNLGGFAPLHLACQNGHNQTCREILLAGAHPDIQNNYGDTSLHTSARYGHAGVTRILISAECRVSEQNKNGDTALHIAAAMGRRKLTRILLEAGCDKALRNKQGETARDIATRKDLNEIIQILNMPASKPKKDSKKEKRDKSREKSVDEPDSKGVKKHSDKEKTPEKGKDKKKTKSVHFEPAQPWSPYGCHYYPDPKFFPKPKLNSLPGEPLKKGEQYYLDLAGNIRKGPIGVGYTCYCAPFFKHMENKLNEDKRELKRHIDKAHEKLDQKVTSLEMKTQGQITELTRYVAAERSLCKERHVHLEQWLTRGMMFRASERVKKLDYSPKGSLDIPPLKRTRSLEVLDTNSEEWNKVNKIIRNFNHNAESYETQTKDLNNTTKLTSKSTDVLDKIDRKPPKGLSKRQYMKTSKSTDELDCVLNRSDQYSLGSRQYNITNCASSSVTENTDYDNNMQSVTAEIHVKKNNISVSHSPVSTEIHQYNKERYLSPSRQSKSKYPSNSNRPGSDYRTSESDGDTRTQHNYTINGSETQNSPVWKSQVLQRTADDIRKRVLFEKEQTRDVSKDNQDSCVDISQDGYIKISKHANVPVYPKDNHSQYQGNNEPSSRRTVQELVAQVEQSNQRDICEPADPPLPRRGILPSETFPESKHSVTFQQNTSAPQVNVTEQPLRPAPILKEKIKSKRFSFHNLIPFPTRKTFQSPSKDTGNNSESSDEEDGPIRTINEPGPMRNSNLLKTLPLPNYESMSNKNPPPVMQSQHPTQSSTTYNVPNDARIAIPKDAYFHEIPNRHRIQHQMPYPEIPENGLPNAQYTSCSSPIHAQEVNETIVPNPDLNASRNRNPLYHQTGLFDAMMQDHIVREMERIPHCYSGHLDQNTEIEIANQNYHTRDGYHEGTANGLPVYPPHGMVHGPTMQCVAGKRIKPPLQPDHNLLHSRLQSLAINTHLTDTQSQLDRESHNDSGYSTKVYGSSQGPSPSLSGHVECGDVVAHQRMGAIANGKVAGGHQIPHPHIGASSLV